jgi:hypothetical protein
MTVALVSTLLLSGSLFFSAARAQTAPAAAEAAQATTTAAAAATVMAKQVPPRTPDLLEHLVDEVLALFNVSSSGNTTTR